MPTRYGRPDATIRPSPHRQPPVNRSMLRLSKIKRSEWTRRSLPGAKRSGRGEPGALGGEGVAEERRQASEAVHGGEPALARVARVVRERRDGSEVAGAAEGRRVRPARLENRVEPVADRSRALAEPVDELGAHPVAAPPAAAPP